MKILIVKTAYHEYIRAFYRRHKGLRTKGFASQRKALHRERFWGGGGDFWKDPMARFGYEVEEILANVKPAQIAWARENGVSITGADMAWLYRTTETQIVRAKPDILFLQDYSVFDGAWLKQLRRNCPSIKLSLVWCGAPFSDQDAFAEHDAVLSCVPELVEAFRERGHTSFHLNHAFDRRINEAKTAVTTPKVDLLFSGRVTQQPGYHNSRLKCLTDLQRQIRIRIHARNAGPLRRLCRPPVFGAEMYEALRNAKVVLNSHIDISSQSASNIRLFEATGVGSCLLTDWKPNLSQLFTDSEVVSYRSAEECAEKARWLLENPQEREAIARAGQARVFRSHLYEHRAEELHHVIGKLLKDASLSS